MSNTTFLCYGDEVQNATVTSTGATTWDPSLQNVKDRRLQKIALADGTGAIIRVLFSASIDVGMIGLLNSNADPDPLFSTWIAYSDASFAVPIATGSFADLAALNETPQNLYALLSLTANITARAFELNLNAVGGAGNLYIGRIFIGPNFWSAQGASFTSYAQQIIDPSTVVRALDGTPYVTQRTKLRKNRLTWPALTESEAFTLIATDDDTKRLNLYGVEQNVGGNAEVILMPDYRAGQIGPRLLNAQTVYGLAEWGETEQAERVDSGLLYSKQVSVTESV
jgi:hypothetical protein